MVQLPDPTVLVIDQNHESAENIRLVLSSHSYQVRTANSAAQAVSIATQHELDLIICDMIVNYQSGLDVVRRIRRLPNRFDVPVLFTSKTQLTGVILKKHPFGDSFHLRKPIEPKVLLELVEHAMWMPALVSSHLQGHNKHEDIAAPHFLPDVPIPTAIPIQPV